MVTIAFWVVFGGLAGWVAALIDEVSDMRKAAAYVFLGIAGALAGGILVRLFNAEATTRIGMGSLIFPTFGAIFALYLAVQRRKQS